MSTKTRYIEPHQAPRVVRALQEAGYRATTEDCTGYAINVARRIDMHAEETVQQVIDQTLDGFYTDAEGYAVQV